MKRFAWVGLLLCGCSGAAFTNAADPPDDAATADVGPSVQSDDVQPDARSLDAGPGSSDPHDAAPPDAHVDARAPHDGDVVQDAPAPEAEAEAAPAPTPEASVEDAAPYICGPGTCLGCCVGNTCIAGGGDNLCGSGGGACVNCNAANRLCVTNQGTSYCASACNTVDPQPSLCGCIDGYHGCCTNIGVCQCLADDAGAGAICGG